MLSLRHRPRLRIRLIIDYLYNFYRTAETPGRRSVGLPKQ